MNTKPGTYTVLLLLALLVSGCGTMKVEPLKTGSAESYGQHDEKNGLVFGVHPFTTRREVKDTFKTDLLAEGLLPILVVAENKSPGTSFVIAKNQVYVMNDTTGTTNTSQTKDVSSGKETAGTALAVATAGGLLSLAGLKMASDATVIQHNIADKEFYSRTLAPGDKAEGFLYFQFPKQSPPSGNYHVIANVKNSANGDAATFDFSVNLTLPTK